MRGYSSLFYVFTILLNVCLFLPVVYSYGMLAPVHMLIFYLSFSSLLKGKKFDSNWRRGLFSMTPSLTLLFVFFGLLGLYSENFRAYMQHLINAPVLPLIMFGVSAFEVIILFWIYTNFKEKRKTATGW